MTSRRELLDSRDPYDANLMGFEGRRDPREEAQGLILSVEPDGPYGPWFYLLTSQGESSPMDAKEARQVALAILKELDGAGAYVATRHVRRAA